MSCPLIPSDCVIDVINGAGKKVATSAWESVCKSFADAAASLMGEFAKAFVSIPPVDLNSEGVRNAYGISLGIAGLVAGLLVLGQVIRTAITHDGSPAAQAVVGLGKALLAFVLTLTVGSTALRAADELTQWIVIRTYGSTDAMTGRIGKIVDWNQGISATLLFVMAVIGILLTIVLWFEMLLRNAAIAVLVATSPIAAAGQTSDATKHWWSRLVAATIQLIILKPVIALVFCLGLSLTGQASDVSSLLAGMLVLLLAAVAWPAIARFFTFASVHVGGGAGLGALLGFAAGRGMNGAGSAGGTDPNDFAKLSEARTMSAVRERMSSQGSPAGNGAAGVGAAALGPVGMLAAGAAMAQRAVNSMTGRMESMAGHAGIPGANPYAQPAGYPMRQPLPRDVARRLSWPGRAATSDATPPIAGPDARPSHGSADAELAPVGTGQPPHSDDPPAQPPSTPDGGAAPTAQQLLRGGLFPGEVVGEEVPPPDIPPVAPEEVPPPPPDQEPSHDRPLPSAQQLLRNTGPDATAENSAGPADLGLTGEHNDSEG